MSPPGSCNFSSGGRRTPRQTPKALEQPRQRELRAQHQLHLDQPQVSPHLVGRGVLVGAEPPSRWLLAAH